MIVTHVGGPLDGQSVEVPRQDPRNFGEEYRYGPTAWIQKARGRETIVEDATPQSTPPRDWTSYRVAVYKRSGLTFHYLRDEEVDRCATVDQKGKRCGAISKAGSAHCDKHDRKHCAAVLPSGRCKVQVDLGSDYCAAHKPKR